MTSFLQHMRGDSGSESAAFSSLLDELKRIARRQLRKQPPGHSLQTTDLVHEAWMKIRSGPKRWMDRDHFLATASVAMRSILVDHAKGKTRAKRGGKGRRRHSLDDGALDDVLRGYTAKGYDIVEIDDVLDALGSMRPELAALVTLRFFGGLDLPAAARILQLAQRTAERHWAEAQRLIASMLRGERVRRRRPRLASADPKRRVPSPRPSRRIAELLLEIRSLLATRGKLDGRLSDAVRELRQLMRDGAADDESPLGPLGTEAPRDPPRPDDGTGGAPARRPRRPRTGGGRVPRDDGATA